MKEKGKSPYYFLRNYELVNFGLPAKGKNYQKKVVTVMYEYALSVRVLATHHHHHRISCRTATAGYRPLLPELQMSRLEAASKSVANKSKI